MKVISYQGRFIGNPYDNGDLERACSNLASTTWRDALGINPILLQRNRKIEKIAALLR